jgi:hypothetical protein
MINKTMVTVVAALLVASAVAGSAHARSIAGTPVSSAEPARMIEVRPGLWVGSYQCVVDLDRGGRDCSSGI